MFGTLQVVDIRGVKLVVAKKEDKVFAFNNRCPHLGLSLKRGEVVLPSRF